MRKIMFQGDSITDALRDRSDNHNLGSGFPAYVRKTLGDGYEYVNYGISGDTSRKMFARHCEEFFREQPDVLVLLIGINDIWRHFDASSFDAVEKDEYVDNVIRTIRRSRELKPSCRIVFVEPYLLPGSSGLLGQGAEMYQDYVNAVTKAVKGSVDLFLPVNDLLNEEYRAGNVCSDDGVHLNARGAEFLGRYIAEKIKPLL